MWKLLIPLVFLACNSTESTDDPETKKASFNLKEACAKSKYYVIEPPPDTWTATVKWIGADSDTHTFPVVVGLEPEGIMLPCGVAVEGDPHPTFNITWD